MIQILVHPHADLVDAATKPDEIPTAKMVAYPQQIAINELFMAERGLAFRGTKQKLENRSIRNRKFVGILELFTLSDKHLTRFLNKVY